MFRLTRLRFILPIFFAFVIVLASSSPVFAQGELPTCSISVEPQTTVVTVGDEFYVQVWIRGLDKDYPMDLFGIIVAWDTTELELVKGEYNSLTGWSFSWWSEEPTLNPLIHFVIMGGSTESTFLPYVPIDYDRFWVTLTFKCLAPGEAQIDAFIEIQDENGQYNDALVVHDHDETSFVEYDINGGYVVVQQHTPAPPEGPNNHVGGQLFTANKVAVLAPYLIGIFSIVAVAAVVVKRRKI